jgi:metal-sulfur cluster biosynthetic enzyme
MHWTGPEIEEGTRLTAQANRTAPTEDAIRDALRCVIDPEAGLNVVDLGLVYGIDVSAGRIGVRMTMTTPACPLGDTLMESARAAIRAAAPKVPDIKIELVWDPPWNPGMMSDIARGHFGWPGR